MARGDNNGFCRYSISHQISSRPRNSIRSVHTTRDHWKTPRMPGDAGQSQTLTDTWAYGSRRQRDSRPCSKRSIRLVRTWPESLHHPLRLPRTHSEVGDKTQHEDNDQQRMGWGLGGRKTRTDDEKAPPPAH